jgi:hypothetical protein
MIVTQNPVLVQALIEARVAELRRAGAPGIRSRGRGRGGEHRVVEGVVRRAGWLLVGMGLRLVASGGAGNRATAREQR